VKKVLLATSLMCLSSFALAHGCPGEMKKIDAAMPTAKLSAADMTKVKSLRAKGGWHSNIPHVSIKFCLGTRLPWRNEKD